MYQILGGYLGYRATPVPERQIQALVLSKRKEIEARKNAEVEADMAAERRKAESLGR